MFLFFFTECCLFVWPWLGLLPLQRISVVCGKKINKSGSVFILLIVYNLLGTERSERKSSIVFKEEFLTTFWNYSVDCLTVRVSLTSLYALSSVILVPSYLVGMATDLFSTKVWNVSILSLGQNKIWRNVKYSVFPFFFSSTFLTYS